MARLPLLTVALALAAAGCKGSAGAPSGDAGPPPSRDVTVTVATSAAAAQVSDRYLSIAVDSAQAFGGPWWSSSDDPSTTGDQVQPPYDFTQPRLRALAGALAPATLRIGGTAADTVYYDLSATPAAAAPAPYSLLLTRSRWDGITSFATALGFDILFTLNAGPSSRDAMNAWTPDNAATLLSWAASRGDPVSVWELGNEVNGFEFVYGLSAKVSAAQYAADFAVAKKLVEQTAPGAKLAGPASAFWPLSGEIAPILPAFVAAAGASIDVVTWHYYPMESVRCPIAELRASPDVVLSPTDLDHVKGWAMGVETARAASAPAAQVWLGETGSAQCGGEPGLSDAFAGSFWWLDQLGAIARRGEPVVIRQSLSGANYGLLDGDTLDPRPDYWTSVLWRRLMGTTVLDVQVSDPEGLLRAYAHCTRSGAPGFAAGAMTLVAINPSRDHGAALSLPGPSTSGAEIYLVTAADLSSPVVSLNGEQLAAGADGSLPPLPGVAVTAIALPPLSYAFVVLPGAAAAACSGG
jgi:heparanase 1